MIKSGTQKLLLIVSLSLCLFFAFAQQTLHAGEKKLQSMEQITIHSPSLEGNLEGNSADRSVYVYLPPSYKKSTKKRYPVLYALHGYTINNEIWSKEINAPESFAAAFASDAKEMIIVLPNSQTIHNGSMYSSSITIGDWESFIADDLVNYIDAHYRTIKHRDSRGLAGHSMGGYGTARIGMKRPDVFSAMYIMSPCCMEARGAPPAAILEKIQNLETAEQSTSLGFLERATLAVAAAWSPNPKTTLFCRPADWKRRGSQNSAS